MSPIFKVCCESLANLLCLAFGRSEAQTVHFDHRDGYYMVLPCSVELATITILVRP